MTCDLCGYQTSKGPAVTFVSLAYEGERTPVTWTSPDEHTRLHERQVSSDDVVVIEQDSPEHSDVCEQIIRYAVIDPTTGKTDHQPGVGHVERFQFRRMRQARGIRAGGHPR